MRKGFLAFSTCVVTAILAACSGSDDNESTTDVGSPSAGTLSLNITEADLAFVNVAVITMTDDRVLEGQTVLVHDAMIVAIVPNGTVRFSDAALIVQGDGHYLIPGLSDMHVHVFSPLIYERTSGPLLVANGITQVRNMWGKEDILSIRDQIDAGELLYPRIVTAGGIIDGDPPRLRFAVLIGDAESALAEMEAQISAGYDFIKVYDRLPADAFDAIARRSNETGFPFAGHVPYAVTIEDAMRAGISSIEHLKGWNDATAVARSPFAAALAEAKDRGQLGQLPLSIAEQLASGEIDWDEVIDPVRRDAVAALAAETGVWNVPTLVLKERDSRSRGQLEAVLAEPAMRYVSPVTLSDWMPNDDVLQQDRDEQPQPGQAVFEESLVRVKALHDAGAGILTGTDTPSPWVVPGFSLHQELALLVEAGLSPYDALVAATRAPAEFLAGESFGTIEVGKRADLVLLEANPLEDIGASERIAGVAIQGRWLPRGELDQMLEGVREFLYDPETPSAVMLDPTADEAAKVWAWQQLNRVAVERWTDPIVAEAVRIGTTSPNVGARASIWRFADASHTHPYLLQPLLLALETDVDRRVRVAAARTLNLYTDQSGVREALRTASANDPDEEVRRRAEISLAGPTTNF